MSLGRLRQFPLHAATHDDHEHDHLDDHGGVSAGWDPVWRWRHLLRCLLQRDVP